MDSRLPEDGGTSLAAWESTWDGSRFEGVEMRERPHASFPSEHIIADVRNLSRGSHDSEDGFESSSFGRISGQETWLEQQRFAAWLLLNNPESSSFGRMFEKAIVLLICVSTLCAILETVPELHEYRFIFSSTEATFTVIFTLELLLRFWVSESSWKFFSSAFNLVDMLATMPGYMIVTLAVLRRLKKETDDDAEVAKVLNWASSARALRVVRMARLMRVLRFAKVARHSEPIQILIQTMRASADALWLLVLMVFTAMLFSATVEYFIESEVEGSQFTSIPATSWWAAATVSTVGYGDTVPLTPLGKIWGSVSIFGSLVIISICVAVLTSRFNEQHHLAKSKRHADGAMARAHTKAIHIESERSGTAGTNSVLTKMQSNLRERTDTADLSAPGPSGVSEPPNLKEALEEIRTGLDRLAEDAKAVLTVREHNPDNDENQNVAAHYAMCAVGLLEISGHAWMAQADRFVRDVLVREVERQGPQALHGRAKSPKTRRKSVLGFESERSGTATSAPPYSEDSPPLSPKSPRPRQSKRRSVLGLEHCTGSEGATTAPSYADDSNPLSA